MARLRKAAVLEPNTILQQPDQTRPRRSSPRKVAHEVSYVVSSDDEENVPLRPKLSTHDFVESSSIFQDDIFFTATSKTDLSVLASTPRKQRTLRPIESNNRLPRKLDDESFASPEKRFGSERRVRLEKSGSPGLGRDIDRKRTLMYSKSLARSVAGRDMKRANSRIDVLGNADSKDARGAGQQQSRTDIVIREDSLEPEDATSILCGVEADVSQEVEEQQVETNDDVDQTFDDQQKSSNDQDSEDDGIFFPVRARQRRPQRCIESSSESESEFEKEMLTVDENQNRQENDHMDEEEVSEESQPQSSMRLPLKKGNDSVSNWAQGVVDLTHSPQGIDLFVLPEPTRARSSSFAVSRPTTSSSDSLQPFLTYSPTPTKKRSPCKVPPASRPNTPPALDPNHVKLASPSKKKPLIPSAPGLRPSLDAFWDPEVINDWNDRHSPAKRLVSPKKQQWRNDVTRRMGRMDLGDASGSDGECTSPILGPNRTAAPFRSPKKSQTSKIGPALKEVQAQKKDFAAHKEEIASSFLIELDATICSGRIAKLSEATGGIKLIWSNTLKTTAGRANWRREVIRNKGSSDPPTYTSEIRHHCSIELASKVIDDSSRLYNVLAHEFCHLLTFMISEVRNNPHGAEFKAWGRKVSAAFAHRDVEVTTKHSYAIEYKFIWECVSCGYEFKRHSRSVDTTRHSCGKCKGKLVQTKPAPRGGAKGKEGEGAKRSEYQNFVKENFRTVKEEMASKGLDTRLGKIMEVVAKRYRESRDTQEGSSNTSVEKLNSALISLSI